MDAACKVRLISAKKRSLRKEKYVKKIQIFDGAENAVYDIFAATDEEFGLIFPSGTDVAFIDEVYPGDQVHKAVD